mmetsp:Transcript_14042/g.21856  ORF Transcript_14042/g.21856 Transcript_14042/m.21856 type:complete len:87 (-) Transcript_14042:61-321(-)
MSPLSVSCVLTFKSMVKDTDMPSQGFGVGFSAVAIRREGQAFLTSLCSVRFCTEGFESHKYWKQTISRDLGIQASRLSATKYVDEA